MNQNKKVIQEQQDIITRNDGSGAGSPMEYDHAQVATNEHSLDAAVAGLEAKIKDARKELQDIHMFSGRDYTPEAKKAADKISEDIEWYEKNLKTLTSAMVQAIKPISLRDIPKFQIMGQAKHYPDQPRFTSVEHFFNAFENVVKASGNDVNLVWKRYVPLSMAFEYKNWTDNYLLVQKDWESAKDLFRKHFGAPDSAEESMASLFGMRMKESDTLQEYTNTFIKHVQDCGFPSDSNLLARFYQFTLLKRNKQMMINQMAVRRDAQHKWTINEIYECILPLFLVDEQNREMRDEHGGAQKGKRKADGFGGGSRNKGAKMMTSGFFCPKHGGDASNHNAADCRSRVKNFGSNNKPNRATFAAPVRSHAMSSPSNICDHCKKPREYGHKCREFYDWKRRQREAQNKNINVHTVQTKEQPVAAADVARNGNAADGNSADGTTATAKDTTALESSEDIDMEELDSFLDEIDAEEASLA